MADSELLESAASPATSFDAFAWLETALSTSAPTTLASSLAPRLALRSQSLSQTLQTSLQAVAHTVPSLHTRLHALQLTATPLGADLHVAQSVCTSLTSDTSSSRRPDARRLLVTLHETKRRLESCSQALVEAARWTRYVRDCFAVIEDPSLLSLEGPDAEPTDDAETLGDRVRQMRSSLDVLKDLPGVQERRRTMERLETQIEAAVLPRVATKLRQDDVGDVTRLCWCLDVLNSIDRGHVMKAEFCQARPVRLHREWFKYEDERKQSAGIADDDADGDGDDGGDRHAAFARWLDSFYENVLLMLQRESRNARELFGGDVEMIRVLLTLLHNTLEPLTASFRDRLEQRGLTSSDCSFRLDRLVRCFHATRRFAGQLVQLVRSLETELGVKLADSNGMAASAEDGILRIVFEPYRLYFTEYTRFACDFLTDALMRLVPSFHATSNEALGREDEEEEDRDAAAATSLEDFSQRLEEASEAVWTVVDESVQQCYEFTGGFAFPEALEAIGTAVQQFTLSLGAKMPAIRKYCKAEPTLQVEGDDRRVAALPGWGQFHASLALLKACGILETQLCAVDGRLRVRMREQLAQHSGDNSDVSSPRSLRRNSCDDSSIARANLLYPTKLVVAVSAMWLCDEDPTRRSQFRQFVSEMVSRPAGTGTTVSCYPTATVLDEAQRAVCSWTKEVQLLTYDTIFLPIARVLATIPTNEIWHKTLNLAQEDLELPTFSMLPQDYITTVADLLLSLLPQLEPFAESNSLENAFVASRGAQEMCVQGEWDRLGQILQLGPSELSTCQQIFGSSGVTPASEQVPTAAKFVDLWSATVASSTLAALLRMVCSISRLSEIGAKQLAADLGYFYNVLSAVGGEENFIIDDLRHALETDVQTHIQHIKELLADHDSPEKRALVKLNNCIVAIRQRALEPARPSFAGSASASSQVH
uniref:Conserved oligomeric Golgi complex subunit 7 n=1 Tax=Peronospora matthiolae TaxID=2874970 RepID=A0AAV1UA33_9STRA